MAIFCIKGAARLSRVMKIMTAISPKKSLSLFSMYFKSLRRVAMAFLGFSPVTLPEFGPAGPRLFGPTGGIGGISSHLR